MRYLEILLEYNQQALINTYKEKVDTRIRRDHSITGDITNFISEIETPLRATNKLQIIGPYMKWILSNYASKKIRWFEDIQSKVIPDLLKYDALKRKNKLQPNQKDINQLNPEILSELVDSFEEVKSKQEETKEEELAFYKLGQAELIFNNEEVKVVVPKTKEASCYFGTNTKWCTAARDRNYFNEYFQKGPLYVVLIKKENKRFQFHFQTNQFMDEKDQPVNIHKLEEKYPILWDIFTPIAEKNKSVILNKNPSKEVQLDSVTKKPWNISYIKAPSEEVQLTSIQKSGGHTFSAIAKANPTEKVQLAAVKLDPPCIGLIKNPTEEMKTIAVTRNGWTIKSIKNPSEELQMLALKQDIYAIKYIKNPTEKAQLFVINQDVDCFRSINNPTEKVQLTAVKKDGFLIRNIKDPSEAVQLAAVKRNRGAFLYIKNPTKKVFELYDS